MCIHFCGPRTRCTDTFNHSCATSIMIKNATTPVRSRRVGRRVLSSLWLCIPRSSALHHPSTVYHHTDDVDHRAAFLEENPRPRSFRRKRKRKVVEEDSTSSARKNVVDDPTRVVDDTNTPAHLRRSSTGNVDVEGVGVEPEARRSIDNSREDIPEANAFLEIGRGKTAESVDAVPTPSTLVQLAGVFEGEEGEAKESREE
ncbi:unnamed protein product [Amoebophrya sp. A25]|nr:unnamed protein product [Amoebophrya sp. A25]|eukprot:GSA25T00013076001.1